MKRFTTLIALAFTLLAPSAHAGLLLEPYVNYGVGGDSSAGGPSYNLNGFGYGGRVGFESFTGLMLGADFMSGAWMDNAHPANNVTPQDLSVFVGYDFPMLVRVWGEYGVSSQLKMTQGNYSNTFKGTDVKVGLGFKVVPMVSLNLEYIIGTYTKDNAGTLANKVTDHVLQVGVSLPFNLL